MCCDVCASLKPNGSKVKPWGGESASKYENMFLFDSISNTQGFDHPQNKLQTNYHARLVYSI